MFRVSFLGGGKDSSNQKKTKDGTPCNRDESLDGIQKNWGKSEAPGIVSKLSLLCVNHRIIEKSSTQVVQDFLHREYHWEGTGCFPPVDLFICSHPFTNLDCLKKYIVQTHVSFISITVIIALAEFEVVIPAAS